MIIVCAFNNSLLTSRRICDRSPGNILSGKTNYQKGVTQLRGSILSFGVLAQICSICINQVYSKFRTMFLFISVDMIYTNEADFRYDNKWQNTICIDPHLCAILFLRSNCYLVTAHKNCQMPVMNNWTHSIFAKIHNVIISRIIQIWYITEDSNVCL